MIRVSDQARWDTVFRDIEAKFSKNLLSYWCNKGEKCLRYRRKRVDQTNGYGFFGVVLLEYSFRHEAECSKTSSPNSIKRAKSVSVTAESCVDQTKGYGYFLGVRF